MIRSINNNNKNKNTTSNSFSLIRRRPLSNDYFLRQLFGAKTISWDYQKFLSVIEMSSGLT